jgi:hypothetical protein
MKNIRNGDLNYEKTEYFGTDHLEELQSDGNTIPTSKQLVYF